MKNRHQILGVAIKKLQSRGIAKAGISKLNDTVKILNVDLSGKGAGRFDLIDSTTKKVDGITNFDGNVLNNGRDIVIDSMRFVEALDGATSIVTADFSNTDGKACQQLSHAQFFLEQDGVVLIDLPFTDINKSDANAVEFKEIATQPIVLSGKEFDMYIKLPNGVTVPANKYGRFEFRCIEAIV